jgi:hypothetical protein
MGARRRRLVCPEHRMREQRIKRFGEGFNIRSAVLRNQGEL